MKNLSTWKWGRIFLNFLLLSVALNTVTSYFSNKVYADTTGWVDVAIDSKDTKAIGANLIKAKAGMEKWKATSGNAYILFPTPASDMVEVNKNLDGYITRAAELDKLDRGSKEYQDGLTDLNSSFTTGLYLYADDFWLRHDGIVLFIASQIVDLLLLLSFIAMIAYSIVNNRKILPLN